MENDVNMLIQVRTCFILMLTIGLFAPVAAFAPVHDLRQVPTDEQDLLDVNAVAWSHDGTKIASVGIRRPSIQGYIRVLDVETGQLVYAYSANPGGFTSVAWGPDDQFIAVGGYDQVVRVFDIEAQQPVAAMFGHMATVSDVHWNGDGTQLVSTGNWDGLTLLWDMDTYIQVRAVEKSDWHPLSAAFSPDNQQFAVGGENGIRVYSSAKRESNELIWSSAEVFYVGALAWNHRGNRIALGSQTFPSIADPNAIFDAHLYIIDAADGTHLLNIPTHDETIFGVDWSADDTLIATYSVNGFVRIWEVSSGSLLESFVGATRFPKKLDFSPYGGRLAYGGSTPFVTEAQAVPNSSTAEGIHMLGGVVHIVVPAPSLNRLRTVTQACGLESSLEHALMDHIAAEDLQSFITDVSRLTRAKIPTGCKADVLAVAEALMVGKK